MVTVTPTERANHADVDATSEPESFEAVVIGGGQAGLAAGYYLTRKGLRFVILDAHDRVGDAWRRRWDTLRLFTPARYSGLPGMPFPAPPWTCPTKDAVADYLEEYAAAMQLPVRTGIKARRVSQTADGGWAVETNGGPLNADVVIVATGGYQIPNIPEWAGDIDPDIVQLHSMDYRNPAQFQSGPVLVVGASHSGAEIAIEAARDYPTVLVGRDTGQVLIRSDGRLDRFVTPVLWFALNHVVTVDTPIGRKVRPHVRAHGFPLERTRRSDLAAAGVERITARVAGARAGKPMLSAGQVFDVRNIVWCTGFRGDYTWIEGLTYGADGYPEQEDGAATGAPGLFFVGLKFQRAGVSSLIGGVGRDAKRVVDQIAVQSRHAA